MHPGQRGSAATFLGFLSAVAFADSHRGGGRPGAGPMPRRSRAASTASSRKGKAGEATELRVWRPRPPSRLGAGRGAARLWPSRRWFIALPWSLATFGVGRYRPTSVLICRCAGRASAAKEGTSWSMGGCRPVESAHGAVRAAVRSVCGGSCWATLRRSSPAPAGAVLVLPTRLVAAWLFSTLDEPGGRGQRREAFGGQQYDVRADRCRRRDRHRRALARRARFRRSPHPRPPRAPAPGGFFVDFRGAPLRRRIATRVAPTSTSRCWRARRFRGATQSDRTRYRRTHGRCGGKRLRGAIAARVAHAFLLHPASRGRRCAGGTVTPFRPFVAVVGGLRQTRFWFCLPGGTFIRGGVIGCQPDCSVVLLLITQLRAPGETYRVEISLAAAPRDQTCASWPMAASQRPARACAAGRSSATSSPWCQIRPQRRRRIPGGVVGEQALSLPYVRCCARDSAGPMLDTIALRRLLRFQSPRCFVLFADLISPKRLDMVSRTHPRPAVVQLDRRVSMWLSRHGVGLQRRRSLIFRWFRLPSVHRGHLPTTLVPDRPLLQEQPDHNVFGSGSRIVPLGDDLARDRHHPVRVREASAQMYLPLQQRVSVVRTASTETSSASHLNAKDITTRITLRARICHTRSRSCTGVMLLTADMFEALERFRAKGRLRFVLSRYALVVGCCIAADVMSTVIYGRSGGAVPGRRRLGAATVIPGDRRCHAVWTSVRSARDRGSSMNYETVARLLSTACKGSKHADFRQAISDLQVQGRHYRQPHRLGCTVT